MSYSFWSQDPCLHSTRYSLESNSLSLRVFRWSQRNASPGACLLSGFPLAHPFQSPRMSVTFLSVYLCTETSFLFARVLFQEFCCSFLTRCFSKHLARNRYLDLLNEWAWQIIWRSHYKGLILRLMGEMGVSGLTPRFLLKQMPQCLLFTELRYHERGISFEGKMLNPILNRYRSSWLIQLTFSFVAYKVEIVSTI